MAHDVYRLSVDYTYAQQVTPALDTGKVAFVPYVQFYAGGTAFDVNITGPLGTKAIAAAVAVTPATSSSWAVTGPLTAAQLTSTTAAFTSVNSGIVAVAILAANANRKGGLIVNTDVNALYLDMSVGSAAATRLVKVLAQNETWEIPFGYTGPLSGIWAADGSGAALITELT